MITPGADLLRRDNQDGNPATIRMRCAAAGVTKGGRSPTGVTPAAASTPEGASFGGNGGW